MLKAVLGRCGMRDVVESWQNWMEEHRSARLDDSSLFTITCIVGCLICAAWVGLELFGNALLALVRGQTTRAGRGKVGR